MSTFWLTLILAIAVIFIALVIFAIGWLVSGQSKLHAGACGRDPTKKRNDKSCGEKISCTLCEKEDK